MGEEIDDWRICRELVKKIAYHTRLPYFTITPTFSICTRHDRIKGKRFVLPVADQLKSIHESWATLEVLGFGIKAKDKNLKTAKLLPQKQAWMAGGRKRIKS